MNITTCLFTVLGGMATLGHPSETVRLNQLGYYPQQEKVAVVNAGEVREFTIVDAATGNRLLSGKPGYTASSAWSDRSRTILDFSDITVPGRYLLLVNGDSVAFEVNLSITNVRVCPSKRLMRVGGAVRQAIQMTRCWYIPMLPGRNVRRER